MDVVQPKVLVIDDDELVLNASARLLSSAGFEIRKETDGQVALSLLQSGQCFDAIVTDLEMPVIHGLNLVRAIREFDHDVPVVVVTGSPSLESAIATVEHRGFRYLLKPVPPQVLIEAVRSATALHRLNTLKRQAAEFTQKDERDAEQSSELSASYDRAMEALWVAFQPIVDLRRGSVFGFEALVRSREPSLPHPGALFDAAERLARLPELGRSIRRQVAELADQAPPDALLFVNLHAADLEDEQLLSRTAPLSQHAARVVLELTERHSLDRVSDVRARIARLRELGYRIAVDDLGAGYAGLSSFAQLEPDIVKLDMSLVRDVDRSPRRQSLVRSMLSVCTRELGTGVVCEGVETPAERDTLAELGADLLQGYWFGRPQRGFHVEDLATKLRAEAQ